jgi:hypothetical protein
MTAGRDICHGLPCHNPQMTLPDAYSKTLADSSLDVDIGQARVFRPTPRSLSCLAWLPCPASQFVDMTRSQEWRLWMNTEVSPAGLGAIGAARNP